MNQDVIIVEDEKEKVVFYFSVFCELLKECIAKYGNMPFDKAEQLVDNAAFLQPEISSVVDIVFFSHESAFHWAMIILYGDNYWQTHLEYAIIPDDYDAFETEIFARYHLEDCYDFIDKR